MFLSLVLLIIISLICQVMEEAVFQADRIRLFSSTELSLQGVLGEYNLELLENYGLFFFEASDEQGKPDKEKILSRLDYYMYRNIENTGGMLQMELAEEEIENLGLATDKEGQMYYEQVVEAYKIRFGEKAIKKAGELLSNYNTGTESRKTLDEKNVSFSELEVPKDIVVDKEGKKKAEEIVNPVDVINALRKNGILGLLTFDKIISYQTLDLKTTLQKRKLSVGNYNAKEKTTGADELIFNLYLKEVFSNFATTTTTAVEKSTELCYQQEYIVGGKESDLENLKAVVEKIIWLREGVNFVYLLSDQGKLAEAESLAIALVGYTGLAPLIAATKVAILAAWAYGESLVETRILLQGGKISFQKRADNWHLSLNGLTEVSNIIKGNNTGDREGMSYEDYLWLLFNTTSKKDRCYRSMDLIEQKIRMITGEKNFQMDHCITYISVKLSASSRGGKIITVKRGMGY